MDRTICPTHFPGQLGCKWECLGRVAAPTLCGRAIVGGCGVGTRAQHRGACCPRTFGIVWLPQDHRTVQVSLPRTNQATHTPHTLQVPKEGRGSRVRVVTSTRQSMAVHGCVGHLGSILLWTGLRSVHEVSSA